MLQAQTLDIETLRYPIGKFQKPEIITEAQITKWIDEIEKLPNLLDKAVFNLIDEQLNTPYRPEGWTIRQVVHHLPDSHLNAYTRFKLTLTEDKPTIKPYKENLWAELEDGKNAPIQFSLRLLEALHYRWVFLLKSLSKSDLQRTYIHPEYNKEYKLEEVIGIYAWHSNHHLAQIENLKKRMNWG